MDYWKQHLLMKIRHATVWALPYSYMYVYDVFPKRMYERLVKNRPAPASYEAKTTYPGRNTEVCRALTPLWQAVGDFVESKPFRDTLCKKFACDPQGRSLYYLHRDKPGFHITPHTDVQSKLLSYIFYFPKTSEYPHLGTWMLRPKQPDYPWSETHKPWEDFDKAKLSLYMPNTLFIWLVDQQSYHAVDIPEDAPVRHTLRGFIFREDVALPYTFAEDYA